MSDVDLLVELDVLHAVPKKQHKYVKHLVQQVSQRLTFFIPHSSFLILHYSFFTHF